MKRRNDFSLFEDICCYSTFVLFASCIEYVGKGSGSRRNHHTKQAKKRFGDKLNSKNVGGHIELISQIWSNGEGVQSIEFGTDATNLESLCREAAVIAWLTMMSVPWA